MIALTVQNPCHKCDWETRMTTEKKYLQSILDCNNDYYTEIIIIILIYIHICNIYIYMCVLQLTHQSKQEYIISSAVLKIQFCCAAIEIYSHRQKPSLVPGRCCITAAIVSLLQLY